MIKAVLIIAIGLNYYGRTIEITPTSSMEECVALRSAVLNSYPYKDATFSNMQQGIPPEWVKCEEVKQ